MTQLDRREIRMVESNNVILITIDALRADHCSFINSDKETTPFLESTASESLVFTQAFANGPGTPASFASLLSSTYPLMYGGYEQLSAESPALQAYLNTHGIRTAGIHSNPYLSRHFGYQRGFDYFDDSFEDDSGTVRRVLETTKRRVGGLLARNKRTFTIGRQIYNRFIPDSKPYVCATETTDKALSWIDHQASESYFLWVHYLDPHEPYLPSPEYRPGLDDSRVQELNTHLEEDRSNIPERDVNDLRALYDGEIRYVDTEIERLFSELSDRNVLSDTTVIITADHGEEFLDHGELGHHPKLYDELLHVPLLLHGPRIDSGIVEQPVDLLSIAPTVVEAFGLPSNERFLGTSLFDDPSSRPIISEVSNPHGVLNVDPRLRKRACRYDGWKLIVNDADDDIKLYDVEADPDETRDWSDERSGIVAQLQEHLDAHPADGEMETDVNQEGEEVR